MAAGAGCGVLETYLSSIDQVSEFILFVFIAVFSRYFADTVSVAYRRVTVSDTYRDTGTAV
jgi:hypothetical protein